MAEPDEVERLCAGAAELGLLLTDDQAGTLVGYTRLLERWNEKFNLVSRRDVGRLVSRHLLDSLSINGWLAGNRVLDIGSGAGLPGIPLAVVNKERTFTLVDRGQRKARFLEHVVMTFELANVEVRCMDASALGENPGEKKAAQAAGGFTTIVCRAVAGLEAMWRIAEPLLAEGGRLVFMNRTDVQPEDGPDPAHSRARLPLPADLLVTTEQVSVPGLAAPHEFIVVEQRP